MNGFFSAIILGTVVEESVADKFRENLGDVSTEEAIRWFVYEVANGNIKIAREKKDET